MLQDKQFAKKEKIFPHSIQWPFAKGGNVMKVRNATLLILLVLLILCNSFAAAAPGRTLPTVSITGPASGTTYTSARTVTITASATDNKGVTRVEFYDGAALEGTDTAAPYTYTWTFTSANKGTHTWTAKAYDSSRNSSVSNPVTLTVNISGDTTSPAGSISINSGAAYTNSSSVTLTLSASDPSGVSQRCISNTTSCSTWEAYATSKSWTLQTGDGTKTVYVWYKDSVGNANTTPYSDTITLDATAPAIPSGLTATAISSSQINLSWSPSTDTGSSGLKGYNVYRNGTYLKQVLAPSTSTSDTGLNASTSYSYTVSAIDNAGNQSAQSTASSVTTPACPDTTAPSVPAGLTATAASCSQINLSWTASTDNTGGSGLKGYNVYRNGTYLKQVLAPSTSTTDTEGLTGSTIYSYTVTAVDNASNPSAQSNTATTNTPPCSSDFTPPSVPTGFRAWASNCTQVGLMWTASSDNPGGSGLKGYNIYRDGIFLMQVTSTSCLDTLLDPSKTYSYAVSAVDNAGNESAQSALSQVSLNGVVSFKTPVAYATGAGPYSVAIGDLNSDGVLDLIVANYNSNNISVLLGRGDGTFQTQLTYTTGTNPRAVAIGDLNSDGKLDVVTVNTGSNTVSVLLGRDDGTFQTQVTYATGSSPTVMAIGDLNRDGVLDIAAANFGSGNVSVLLGRGDGTFQTQLTYAVGRYPLALAIGDLNSDGMLDLVTANSGSNDVSVLLGSGNGSFQPEVAYLTGSQPKSVAIGDLNGDGVPDMTVSNFGSATVSVLLGHGDGTFQALAPRTVFGLPSFLAIGKLNRDSKPDLAVTSQQGNIVDILTGDGTGTFQDSAVTPATGSSPVFVIIGDLNRDGASDLVVANSSSGTVSVMLNACY